MHHGAAGEIQHTRRAEESAAPHPMRDRHVNQQQPAGDEPQISREPHAVGDRACDQRHGDDREGHLVEHEHRFRNGLGERADGVHAHAAQQHALERADRRAFAGEGEAVAEHHPEDRAERRRRPASAPWSRACSSCAPCRRRTAPGPGCSSSARARSPKIIHAVSAASILAGCAAACASAGVAAATSWQGDAQRAPLRASARLGHRLPLPRSDFLQRVVVGLAGADAHGAIEVVNEDFSVADLAGLGRVADRGDDLVFDAVFDARPRP